MNRQFRITVAVFFILVLLIGCNGPSSSSSSNAYVGTQTSGDLWKLSATTTGGAKTYSAQNMVTGYAYSGIATALSGNAAGFSEIVFSSSNDPAYSSSIPGFGVEIPGTLVMAVPGPFKTLSNGDNIPYIGSYSPPVIAISQTACPTSGGTFNWIMVPTQDWCSGDDSLGACASAGHAFGTATITVSGGSYNMAVQPYFLNGMEGSVTTMTGGTCSDGVISGTDSAGNNLNISFTPSGMFFIDLPRGKGSIIGTETLASDFNFSEVLQSGNTFIGWNFTSYKQIGGDTVDPTPYAGPRTAP